MSDDQPIMGKVVLPDVHVHPAYHYLENQNSELASKLAKAVSLLARISKANVIFPSMCANNMEAWIITEELKQYAESNAASNGGKDG